MYLVLSFIGGAIALFVTAYVVPGVSFADNTALFVATIILGIVNTFIKPILKLITLPITLLTFGLFSLVINAVTFALVAYIVPGFEVDGIISAFIGAVVLSVVGMFINRFAGKSGNPLV